MHLLRCVVPAVVGMAAVFGAAGPAAADVVVVGASRDNTLYGDTTGSLSNGIGQHFFAGTNGAAVARRGLIGFDVAAALPAGATVTGVTLMLNMSRGEGAAYEVSLHRALGDWGEGTTDADGNEGGGGAATAGSATWIHRFHDGVLWGAAGGDFVAGASGSASVGGLGGYTWSSPGMVADVQAWLDGTAGNFGWAMIGEEEFDSTAKRFDSRENPDAMVRPQLVVEYVPGPGTAVLAVVGAATLARRRRG